MQKKITSYRICKISWNYCRWRFKYVKKIWGNTILSNIRNYVNKGTLRTVYFAIFHSYINYVSIMSISYLYKKALRIMHFAEFNSHTSPLFDNSDILKFIDSFILNIASWINSFNKDSFAVFAQNHNLCANTHT